MKLRIFRGSAREVEIEANEWLAHLHPFISMVMQSESEATITLTIFYTTSDRGVKPCATKTS